MFSMATFTTAKIANQSRHPVGEQTILIYIDRDNKTNTTLTRSYVDVRNIDLIEAENRMRRLSEKWGWGSVGWVVRVPSRGVLYNVVTRVNSC